MLGDSDLLMNISHEHKCIFIHIPKAAGTSVKKSLNLGGRGHPPWHYFSTNFPNEWKTYKKFTIVRNPWDRMVSAYCYARMEKSFWHNSQTGLHPDFELLRDKSFEECCEMLEQDRQSLTHESWHSQHLWIAGMLNGKLACAVDYVLRCESLDRDFSRLCEALGKPQTVLPHINKSERMLYKDYYNAKTRSTIARLYATDIELLGYSF